MPKNHDETQNYLTDDREVEPVGQRQTTLVKHQVDDGEVVVILLKLGDEVLVQDGLTVLGQEDLVPADHLPHRPEYVRAKAPDKLQRKLELCLKTINEVSRIYNKCNLNVSKYDGSAGT